MSNELPPIQEFFGGEIRHCMVPFSPIRASTFTELETLPYNDLGGRGLERLCFELLLSMGYEPRFFGRSGQSQYGVDLVAEKAGRTEVYQCKNLGAPPTPKELQEYLNKFEREWLGEAGLPRPERFVICCPQPLRDTETDRNWILAKEAFKDRTDVEARLWHLDLLNGWLENLPDVVADLFSNHYAEVFCGIEDWKPDLFTPLREGASGDLRLNRYFERRRSGRLYVDDGYEEQITEALEHSPVILVRGLPGTGKTFTSLAVAEGFRDGRWRTYFLDAGDNELTKGQMKAGIRRRLSRPSIFVLENCHEKLGDVDKVLRDLEPELKSGHAKVICLTRRVPGPDEYRSDDSELFLVLESQGATVDFENDDALLIRVVEFWRPEFKGLSKKRLAKLGALCGRDLYLLDEVLTLIESPAEIDTFSPAEMYNRVRRAYFDYKIADDLPATRRLAALAQFDLRPRADVLKLPDDELALIESLCVRAGHPPRWHFLHSTAAELVMHALWSGMGVTDSAEVAGEAAKDVIDYFRDIQADYLRPAAEAVALETDLLGVVGNRLKLAGEDGEKRLKAAVLDSQPVRNLLSKLVALPTYPRTISRCAFVAHRTGAASAQVYAQQLRGALEDVLNSADQQRLAAALPLLGVSLRALKLAAPALHADIIQEFNAEHLLQLIEANGTVCELFMIAAHASPALARGLIEALDEARVERLIQKTIAAGRSIGTLNLALRGLRMSKETAALGEVLEQKIGPARFLRLIEANGTVCELFMIIQYASPALARGLIEALDEARVERLIQKTIAAGRSIGTLHFALRELHRSEETAALGEVLEQKIGPARFLRLIEANGTVCELFRIAAHASPALARGLIEALDEARVERLIQKTIAAGRSIGTLDLALRGLRMSKETAALGQDLERKIGAGGFWTLLVGTGSPGPLVDLLKDVSPAFGRQLLAAARDLSQEQWEQMLGRGDLFQLCELISDGPAVFEDGAGGPKLLAAVEGEAPRLAARSNWYQRNGGAKRLATCPESLARNVASQALDGWLAQVEVQRLSFPSLKDAVNGLELLYEQRPDARSSLAAGLRVLLPPQQWWMLNPKEDMALPRLLLRLVAKPEFGDADAEQVVGGLMQCLTPQLIAKCRTVDILWTLWALFALARRRKELAPAAFGQSLPSEFMRSLKDSLAASVGQKGKRDELRARFALVGLFSLLDSRVDSSVVAALGVELARCAEAGAWWLSAEQTFVTAWLVLRGVEMAKPFPARLKGDFLRRLLSAAAEYPEMDPAAEYLREDVLRQVKELDAAR